MHTPLLVMRGPDDVIAGYATRSSFRAWKVTNECTYDFRADNDGFARGSNLPGFARGKLPHIRKPAPIGLHVLQELVPALERESDPYGGGPGKTEPSLTLLD